MRLSPDVLAVLRGKGRGWQTLVDDTLREHFIKTSIPAKPRSLPPVLGFLPPLFAAMASDSALRVVWSGSETNSPDEDNYGDSARRAE
jgi:hypothetical protein